MTLSLRQLIETAVCEARNTYVERGQFDFDGHVTDVVMKAVTPVLEALKPFAEHYTDHELSSQLWGDAELLPYVGRDGLRRWLRTDDFLRARAIMRRA